MTTEMRKYLIIAGYFIFFWILIPAGIFFLSVLLDKAVFNYRELSYTWSIPGYIIAISGFLLLLRTVYQFKLQSGEYPVSALPAQKLIQRDVFIVWRHPIYLFASITLFGASLVLGSCSMLLIIFPVFMILAWLYILREEAILIKRFGNQYLYYRNIVPLIIPHMHQWIKIPGAIFFKIWFRLKIRNRENIPSSLPFIVVSGHRNYLDPFLISYAVPYPLRHISTFEMFRSPLIRRIFTWGGAIPRRRFVKDISGTKRIITALKKGYPVCFFPEGGRSWTGQLRPFKPEVLKLFSLLKDILILPVRIEGNYHSWPRWADRLMRADITITFEKPVLIEPGMDVYEMQDFLLQMVKPGDEVEAAKVCRSRNRISHLSKVIYRCPVCMCSERLFEIVPDTLKCSKCRSDFILRPDFSIEYCNAEQKKSESIHSIYNNIRIKDSDIFNLLSGDLHEQGIKYLNPHERLIYLSPGQLWTEKEHIFVRSLKGICVLSDTSVTISGNEESCIILLPEIGAVTIESNCKLQIYNELSKVLYQLTFENDSALKWQDMLSAIIGYKYKKQIITR